MAVGRLNRRLRQERQSELSVSQLSLLGALLLEGGRARPSVLAARERVSAPSITRALKCLEERDLVTRAADPDDGRQVVVTLSDQGQQVIAEERRRQDQWLAQRLRELSAAEQRTLQEAAEIMRRLAES